MKLFFVAVLVGFLGGMGSMANQNQTLETIQGTMVGNDIFCPQFKTQSGETISLSGDFPKAESGTEYKLNGQWREKSKCMRGREFRVLNSSAIN